MNPELQALARRAIACKGWRWVPGMLHRNWRNGTRVTEDHAGYMWDGWPDLSDPASLGCLMALVRDAWGTETAWVEVAGAAGLWAVCIYVSGKYRLLESYQTEAEALVAALEAASL